MEKRSNISTIIAVIALIVALSGYSPFMRSSLNVDVLKAKKIEVPFSGLAFVTSEQDEILNIGYWEIQRLIPRKDGKEETYFDPRISIFAPTYIASSESSLREGEFTEISPWSVEFNSKGAPVASLRGKSGGGGSLEFYDLNDHDIGDKHDMGDYTGHYYFSSYEPGNMIFRFGGYYEGRAPHGTSLKPGHRVTSAR